VFSDAEFSTGMGEAIGMFQLGQQFDRLQRKVIVRRGRSLSWHDTRKSNLVFVGAPPGNLSLEALPVQQEFVFRPMEAGSARAGDLAIANLRPNLGEQAYYLASPGQPLTEDYALIEMLTGISQGQTILLLAGITTLGTQAAVEFVCRNMSLVGILSRLNGGGSGKLGSFAAVLRVKINDGVPVESDIAAIHRLR
jgi:hypothetical protein